MTLEALFLKKHKSHWTPRVVLDNHAANNEERKKKQKKNYHCFHSNPVSCAWLKTM